MLKKLWNDEAGALLSAEFVLLATILVIGSIVGLKAVQTSVVAELADVGQAIANINQSYSYRATTGHVSSSGGASFTDTADFCDNGDSADGQQSKCVSTFALPTAEAGSGANGT